MPNLGLRSPFLRFSTLSLATAGLLSLALLPAEASIRVRSVDYQVCANSLVGVGIAEADAAAACAAALYPQDVSRCVVQIDEGTTLASSDALSGCRRVRRPLELATCVNDISTTAADPELLSVLDNCRRSLLPTRFSACVVGLSLEVSFPVNEAMQTCLAAGNRPRNVRPNFVPIGEPIPATPSASPVQPSSDSIAPPPSTSAPISPAPTNPAPVTPAPTTPTP